MFKLIMLNSGSVAVTVGPSPGYPLVASNRNCGHLHRRRRLPRGWRRVTRCQAIRGWLHGGGAERARRSPVRLRGEWFGSLSGGLEEEFQNEFKWQLI